MGQIRVGSVLRPGLSGTVRDDPGWSVTVPDTTSAMLNCLKLPFQSGVVRDGPCSDRVGSGKVCGDPVRSGMSYWVPMNVYLIKVFSILGGQGFRYGMVCLLMFH